MKLPIDLPVLTLVTVYFHESDREEAQSLGRELYDRLTRSLDDPLAFGPGIPVRVSVPSDQVKLDIAQTVVIIPVLGQICAMAKRDEVLAKISEWHTALNGGGASGIILPLFLSNNWRAVEGNLPVKPLLSRLHPAREVRPEMLEETARKVTPEEIEGYDKLDEATRMEARMKVAKPKARDRVTREETLDEIVLATTRVWGEGEHGGAQEKGNVVPFISHAKGDLAESDEAAKKIHDFIVTDTTGSAFFDTAKLQAGKPLRPQIIAAARQGMLIVVHGDMYASRIWCQEELLTGKLHRLPTLGVVVLRRGERRSSPYCGNGPTLLWKGDPAPIVSQAMVEWLRAAFFRREGKRIKQAANLPDDIEVVARPPELLDLAQGPLRFDGARLVLHPDPELPMIEQQVLKAAQPRMHLATPTTSFRRLLSSREKTVDAFSPLEGMEIALSLSDLPDEANTEGLTKDHMVDATVHIARTLVSSGVALAYGGDFRKNGYTPLLGLLIQTYNQTALEAAQYLHSYLGAPIKLSEAPDIMVNIHHLGEAPWKAEAILPPMSTAGAPPPALYFSDMRRYMEEHVSARVILGGATDPGLRSLNRSGYGGRYPGVVEEAWRALKKREKLPKEKRHPLYLAGGFGGAAALVADLLEGKPIPDKLKDSTWMGFADFAETAGKIDSEANRPWREKLELPLKMEDLAQAIVDLAAPLLQSDEACLRWNGLTVAENRQLWRTQDPVTLASLVSKGLLNIARQQAAGKLKMELVLESVTAARNLDAIAIATLEDVPLGGAGAALDQVTGGLATLARSQGLTFTSLKDSHIDADWLLLASLGKLGDQTPVEERIRLAAQDVADQIDRRGFKRVGMVLFGGNMLGDVNQTAAAMVDGLTTIPTQAAMVLYETDETRFQKLKDFLAGKPEQISLTTLKPQVGIMPSSRPSEPLNLSVRLEDGRLRVTSLLPSGAAAIPLHIKELGAAELEELSRGEGHDQRTTPGLKTLATKGVALAKLLFGENARDIISHCRATADRPPLKILIVHDTAASKVPFELLLGDSDIRPALEGGITRRIEIEDLPVKHQVGRPPRKGTLRVLLVTNPTEDLDGADEEADAIKSILSEKKDEVHLTELRHGEATLERVAAALQEADVLHYCGHGFFNGTGLKDSGLLLAGDVPFTAEDLRKVNPLPRMAFMNACEVGKVRAKKVQRPTSFAELFLRSGIHAYLGAYWEVSDLAAALFAKTVYVQLAMGQTLETSVLEARKALFNYTNNKGKSTPLPDWANYMLFGGADFKLVTGATTA